MSKMSIDQLVVAERDLSFDLTDSYLISYPEFVRFFEALEVIDRHYLIIGANLVYGWMPTILHFKSDDLEGVARLVNEVKRGHKLSLGELTTVKQLVNNSVVGTSKLLHFANPSLYPIWDSKICTFLTDKKHTVNHVESYLEYVQYCDELVRDARFGDVHRSVERKLTYAVSPYRAVELVLLTVAQRGR